MSYKIEFTVTDLETDRKTTMEFKAEDFEYEVEQDPREVTFPYSDSSRVRVERSDPPRSISLKGSHVISDPETGIYMTRTQNYEPIS